jgi:hypothetical protein
MLQLWLRAAEFANENEMETPNSSSKNLRNGL